MNGKRTEYEGEIVVDDAVTTTTPRPYHVVIHNDDFTTMDFVVMVLEKIFNHPPARAERLMQEVHRRGSSVVGTYSFEIAETKVAETMLLAKKNGYPLRCSVHPA